VKDIANSFAPERMVFSLDQSYDAYLFLYLDLVGEGNAGNLLFFFPNSFFVSRPITGTKILVDGGREEIVYFYWVLFHLF